MKRRLKCETFVFVFSCLVDIPLVATAAGPSKYVPGEYHNDEFFVLNQAAAAPVIDGDLSDACWADALELYPFSTLGGGGSLSALDTRVKLAWDKDAFYLAYQCQQPDMLLAQRRGDQLEMFFMPLYRDQAPHVNNATALTALAHSKPQEFHYQQAWGRMGGQGGMFFQKEPGVQSAGKIGPDWWTWEARIPRSSLAVRGLAPPDSRVKLWRIGCGRLSVFHGEMAWYAAMLSSMNHQANHCPVFQLSGVGEAPAVRLTHPRQGAEPGRFSVAVRHLTAGEGTYHVRVLLRKEPFDPPVKLATPLGQAADALRLMHGEEARIEYRVPIQGCRNQCRVEVWDGAEKSLYFRSLWYSLGDPLRGEWDSKRPQLGIIPEPQEVVLGDGRFLLAREIPVLVARGQQADRFAASFLSKPIGSLKEFWPTLRIRETAGEDLPPTGFILLGDLTGNPLIGRFASRRKIDIPRKRLVEQGYFLQITPEYVLLVGADPAGTFYGVQTLRQLVLRDRRSLPALRSLDWPDLAWRGVFHSFEVTEENVDLACLFKINVGRLSLAQQRQYHFQPAMFTAHTWFGHTGGSLVPPEKREDVGGEAVICPASSCKEELAARIDQEARRIGPDAAAMGYVFVGGDEAPFGLDEPCQRMIDQHGAGWTVARHFRDNMLAACRWRRKTMVCWADALLNHEASLELMPKDFHPVYWMYYPSTYYGGCDLLAKHGLPFIVAPMTRGEQSFHFPQIRSREQNIATLARAAARGTAKGIWLTTWGGGLDDGLLWYSYLLAAEYGWSPGPDIHTFRKKFAAVFYGTVQGSDWLLELERMTALYLSQGQTPVPAAMILQDRRKLGQIKADIQAVMGRDWYVKKPLAELLKVVEEVQKRQGE